MREEFHMKRQSTKSKEKPTLESLWAYLYESSRKSELEFEKLKEETRKRDEEARKRDEEYRKRDEERKEEFDRKFKKMVEEIGGIGNSNGDVAEEYFINAFENNPTLNGKTYETVNHNVRLYSEIKIENEKYNDQYDIFLSNSKRGKSVAIIEVKYNIKRDDINETLKKAENFRKFLPQYKKHKLYLGIAGLSFRKVTEERILKHGIAVIKQVGDKMVIYDKDLKAF
jgi:hypothetical protein